MAQERTVQSVERAMKILEGLAREKEGLGVTELSNQVNLHKSTVFRMLTTLLNLGYVEQNPATEKYRLGMKLLSLGGAILERMDIRHEAHDLLKGLSEKVNETVHLVVPDDLKVVYIDKLDGNRTIRMYSQIGRRAPLHASAVGKAILAFTGEEFVSKVIQQGLSNYTSNTITIPKKLLSHLQEIRKQGYAIDDEENEVGIRCVGAPVFDYSGEVVGAISVSGSTATVTREKVGQIARYTVDCARSISRRMGWKPQ